MVEAVRQGVEVVEEKHNGQSRKNRQEMEARWEKKEEEAFRVWWQVYLLSGRSGHYVESLKGEYRWLAHCGSLKQYGFNLSVEVFHDDCLNLCHGQKLQELPLCDGC
eukprot:CAMPEP_0194745790 /NCGR_PEP_ID=MMETSP0296-20130528/101597_1 /TAXON_ID=39354 /ORGANISM="Heterosigma akashiwo, Strain CCMP2393" /LENGTH=106 /DNA_ID=CAMNT_0039658035 /DNA_START=141 /DNA_END=461 /DNA_ORIENTATION=-